MENQNLKSISVPPAYEEMLANMRDHLKERKWSLLSRSLLIVWPLMILAPILIFSNEESMSISLTIFVIFTFSYYVAMSHIFQIEKIVWIDSFHDKKNLSLSQSWKISRKLFWPALLFEFRILGTYYFIPVMIPVLVVLGAIFYFLKIYNQDNGPIIASIIFSTLIIWGSIYTYYIKAKLRYRWFVFIDSYGVNYNYNKLLAEIKNLNQISKTETFKKSLFTSIGTDQVGQIADYASLIIAGGASKFLGAPVGVVTRVFSGEVIKQVKDLGNLASQYILYSFARRELYGEENEQKINEEVYLLVN